LPIYQFSLDWCFSFKTGKKFLSNKLSLKSTSNYRYASDGTADKIPKTLSSGRVSNAPIESFFKILKHSILQHRTNLRPGEFLLALYSTTNARLKASQFNIQQTGSKKHRRGKKQQADQVDATMFMEQWKKQGTATESRGVYFSKYLEQKLVPSDIRIRLREKLQ
jgi:hypothetical protein